MSRALPKYTKEEARLSQHNSTPPSVKNAPYSKWWFEPSWRQMHYSNAGNNLGVVVGGNGTGKSWLLLWVAEKLGVDKGGRKRLFRPDVLEEHVCFDAVTFSDIVSKLMKRPKRETVGYQIILDEGQIALYSKEAFVQEVKNLSKLLMTVRSRRWGVYINLPSFKMLNKDVRSITNWLVWMKGKPGEFSYGTYYDVCVNMMSGEPYLKKPVFNQSVTLPSGLHLGYRAANNILKFPRPSDYVVERYENMKAEHQRELYEKFNVQMHANDVSSEEKEKVQKKEKLEEWLEKANEIKDKLVSVRGGFSANKIAAALGISYPKASKIKFYMEQEEDSHT